MTTEQHQIGLISTLIDSINKGFKVNEHNGDFYLYTESAKHDIESLIKTINSTIEPHLVIVTDCIVTQNYTSYKVLVTTINKIPLPFYLTSEVGYYTFKVSALSDWEIIGIKNDIKAVSIEEVPMYTVLRLIKSGSLRLTTEEVFRERFLNASERIFNKSLTVVPV